MTKLAIILLGLVVANAVFVKRLPSDPNLAVFAQLEDLEETEMGKKLLDTIALQMKNKTPLSDIAKMLQDLRENLVLQQQEADQKHAADEAECAAEITGYNRRITFATNEITEANNEINALQNTIDQTTTQITSINTQLQILNDQKLQQIDTRNREHQEFEQRQLQTPKVIEALDVIASKLGAIQPESDALAVLAELHRIGGDNPILALVSLASTFSPERLKSIQDKIAELRASLEQSIIDDRAAESQAQIDYESLILQIDQQSEALAADRTDAERRLAIAENQLAQQKKRKDDASRELASATAGKSQKETECEAWRTQYAGDTEHRTKEVNIVRQVEEILATKLEGASSYLKGRVGA